MEVPAITLVCNFDGDGTSAHFFKTQTASHFFQVAGVLPELGRCQNREVFLGENEVLWLGDVLHPNGELFATAFGDEPLTPGTPFQRTAVSKFVNVTAGSACSENSFPAAFREIRELVCFCETGQF